MMAEGESYQFVDSLDGGVIREFSSARSIPRHSTGAIERGKLVVSLRKH